MPCSLWSSLGQGNECYCCHNQHFQLLITRMACVVVIAFRHANNIRHLILWEDVLSHIIVKLWIYKLVDTYLCKQYQIVVKVFQNWNLLIMVSNIELHWISEAGVVFTTVPITFRYNGMPIHCNPLMSVEMPVLLSECLPGPAVSKDLTSGHHLSLLVTTKMSSKTNRCVLLFAQNKNIW